MSEGKKRVRRSVEERAAELDKKILAHKEAIKLLEEKKAEIAKELITKAKKAGMSSKDIAEKLGLEME